MVTALQSPETDTLQSWGKLINAMWNQSWNRACQQCQGGHIFPRKQIFLGDWTNRLAAFPLCFPLHKRYSRLWTIPITLHPHSVFVVYCFNSSNTDKIHWTFHANRQAKTDPIKIQVTWYFTPSQPIQLYQSWKYIWKTEKWTRAAWTCYRKRTWITACLWPSFQSPLALFPHLCQGPWTLSDAPAGLAILLLGLSQLVLGHAKLTQQVLQLVIQVLLPRPDLLQGVGDFVVQLVQVYFGLRQRGLDAVVVLVHLLQVDAPVLGVERKLFLETSSRLCGFIFIDLSSFVHTDSIKDSALSGFIFTDLSSFVHTHLIKDSTLSGFIFTDLSSFVHIHLTKDSLGAPCLMIWPTDMVVYFYRNLVICVGLFSQICPLLYAHIR